MARPRPPAGTGLAPPAPLPGGRAGAAGHGVPPGRTPEAGGHIRAGRTNREGPILFLNRIMDVLVGAVTVLAGLCIVAMMVHVTADVIGRYVFNTPLPGTITFVSAYYMVGAAFLALPLAERRGAHINVELVSDLLPRRLQLVLALAARLLTAAVVGLVALRTVQEAGAKAAIGATVQQGAITIPTWPSYFLVPVGCALMMLAALVGFLNEIALAGAQERRETSRSPETAPHE